MTPEKSDNSDEEINKHLSNDDDGPQSDSSSNLVPLAVYLKRLSASTPTEVEPVFSSCHSHNVNSLNISDFNDSCCQHPK